ncbi:MAG: dihydropteroate synthase [Ignavibacteriae bacterium]|nr:MAG: dihydropteroate synthase [Ignavibacteriota bacterium]
MGILNVTPDSFSDGGKYFKIEDAVKKAEEYVKLGAEIIDVGGESTRPGASKVSASEEIDRVIPVIEAIANKFENIVLSVDTTKSEVTREAVKAGVHIINDISGGTFDEKILNVVAEKNIPYVLMHIKGTPENMQSNPYYTNVIEEVLNYFEERIKAAKSKGVNKIILDPGIGFGKRVEDNYCIIKNLYKFNKWNYPLLMGLSRKSFLGKSLGSNVLDRDNATIIAETISVLNGAKIVRTHNVKNAVELKKIMIELNKIKDA